MAELAKSKMMVTSWLFPVLQLIFSVVSTVNADCDGPPSVPNTSTNITGSPPYAEEAVVRYECNLGYSTSGTNRFYTCTGSEWLNGDISCDAIYCPYIGAPENGEITNNPTNEVGTKLTFSCNEGFDLSGHNELLCRTDGEWSPSSAPACDAKDCGEFSSIQHGETFQDNSEVGRNLYGSIVVVTCQYGYFLNGPREVKCGADGQWGNRPTCEFMTCPPYPNTNSTCIEQSTVLGQFYFILCKEGHNISVTRTGPDSSECLSSGWETLDMACYCDCYVKTTLNLVKISNLNSKGYLPHGHQLQWTCDSDGRKSTSADVTCTDGTLLVEVGGVQRMDVMQVLESELCYNTKSSANVLNCGILRYFLVVVTITLSIEAL
ncbi:E-selectin-like isoform X3 [Mercenaria mercenaria]|uniref:E-selectin-like isoform X3 n=1 Tax=Mercenaria mercenaria TaxID=6596 RepID=UPI00234E67A0|nr:E-selectin-like isoform X3 [Mercenaria mercenaria]